MVREKEGAKKRREEVHFHRDAIPGDFGEGAAPSMSVVKGRDITQLKQVLRIPT
jgi:hypothetical protein